LYLPACRRRPALIRYTRDYACSALHEVAHWCLADPSSRHQVDYGFWYQPPPRNPEDQRRFYAAEAPVQALEMLLTGACGLVFHFSADNPGADGGAARHAFEARVRRRFLALCADGADGMTFMKHGRARGSGVASRHASSPGLVFPPRRRRVHVAPRALNDLSVAVLEALNPRWREWAAHALAAGAVT
jgi:hypothetical protein